MLLKWTLVDQGYEPETADRIVQRTDVVLSGFAAGVGLILALLRPWLPALGCFLVIALTVGVAMAR